MFLCNPIGNRHGFDKWAVDRAALVLSFSFTTLRQVESHAR